MCGGIHSGLGDIHFGEGSCKLSVLFGKDQGMDLANDGCRMRMRTHAPQVDVPDEVIVTGLALQVIIPGLK